jgi:hypothetical protein
MPDPDQMSREELLDARARVQHQISELGYGCVIGGGRDRSQTDGLRQRLQVILAEIEQELAELDSSNT